MSNFELLHKLFSALLLNTLAILVLRFNSQNTIPKLHRMDTKIFGETENNTSLGSISITR